MSDLRPANFAALALLLFAAGPALAQSGGYGWPDRSASRSERPEGKVEVTRFVAEGAAAAALGHGPVAVSAAPAGAGDIDARGLAIFEAAVIDQLARQGYDIVTASPGGGQIAELRIVRDVAVPQEAPHRPVSGVMETTVGNRGSGFGLGLAIDLTKPRKALLSTRLEARIRDRASQTVLWEGRAEILTRQGSSRWGDQQIATRLAAALFDHFPGRSGETVTAR